MLVNASLFLGASPARAGEAVEGVSVGLGAGYTFRSQGDGRNHGAGAQLFLDVPLPGPFALRPELVSLGFQGAAPATDPADPSAATRNPQSLGFVAGALSLVYSFDDSDLEALAAVGPLAGVSLERSFAFHGGLLAGIGVRVPVTGAASLDVEVSSPFVVVGPRGVTAPGQTTYADGALVELPLQFLFSFGLVVDVEALLAGDTQGAPVDESGHGYDDATP